MGPSRESVDLEADELVSSHGPRARQKIVDNIVRAIRQHDISAAKHWEEVGKAVDQQLES